MSKMDGFLRQQLEIIDRVGWSVVHVFPTDDDPPADVAFSYTVGLSAHGRPEVLLAGLPPEVAQGLLNNLASRVYDKAERFSHGQRVSKIITGYDTIVVDGPPTDTLDPAVAFALYGRDKVRLQQLVWPDEDGRFPWEAGYGYPAHAQPLIARPAHT